MLGNAYEYLLKQFADESGKKAGEFFTPRSVVRLLTRILDPQPTDTVYDPACGSGGMLVEAANEVIEAGGSVRQMRFYGQEVNLTTCRHRPDEPVPPRHRGRQGPPRATRCATRSSSTSGAGLQRFDVVIANPPFSLKNWGADRWVNDPWGGRSAALPADRERRLRLGAAHGRVDESRDRPGRRRDAARRAVPRRRRRRHPPVPARGTTDSMRSSGCRRTSSTPRRSRRACSSSGRRSPTSDASTSLFVDGSKRFVKGRNQNQMRRDDVEAIVAAYRTATDPDGEGGVEVRVVDHAEIKENGWDLNIGRYLKTAAAEALDVATALANLAEAQQALREAEARLAERLAEAGYA